MSHGRVRQCDRVMRMATGWRRPIGCLISWITFRKLATNYRALLRKMTSKDKASCGSSLPCMQSPSRSMEKWVVSQMSACYHQWMSHVNVMESCHKWLCPFINGWVMSMWSSHVTNEPLLSSMDESCQCGRVMSCEWPFRAPRCVGKWVVSHMNGSCHKWMGQVTNRWVMSTWWSHVMRMAMQSPSRKNNEPCKHMQHTATHCNTQPHTPRTSRANTRHVRSCGAQWCAECCSGLHWAVVSYKAHVTVRVSDRVATRRKPARFGVAVCYSLLCSVLQRVAACCSGNEQEKAW